MIDEETEAIRHDKNLKGTKSQNVKSQLKIPHSEIEKNRRQKMNKHLNDLASCLLTGPNKTKKVDKLSILKMAVAHMKNLKASNSVLNEAFLSQNYMNFEELQSLVLDRSNEFLMAIRCDSGKILYVSDACFNVLGFRPKELVDKLIFEIMHPSDTKQVKDQLFIQGIHNVPGSSKCNLMINKTVSPGDRRSFICRINNKNSSEDSTNTFNPTNYTAVHFVGYLNAELESNLKYSTIMSKKLDDGSFNNESSNVYENHSKTLLETDSEVSKTDNSITYYLIACVSLPENQKTMPSEFMCKFDVNGKFVYAENCIYRILGYLPIQLKSESFFNLIHGEDLSLVRDYFQKSLTNCNTKIVSSKYRIRLAQNPKAFQQVQSVFYCLKNPSSGVIEYVSATNKVMPNQSDSNKTTTAPGNTALKLTSEENASPVGHKSVNQNNQQMTKWPPNNSNYLPMNISNAFKTSNSSYFKSPSSNYCLNGMPEYITGNSLPLDKPQSTFDKFYQSQTSDTLLSSNLQKTSSFQSLNFNYDSTNFDLNQMLKKRHITSPGQNNEVSSSNFNEIFDDKNYYSL